MKTMFLAVTVAVVSVVLWPASVALAQDQQVARGTVSAMSGASLTIDVRGEAMKFSVDSNTQVEARGAGTTTRRLAAAGKPGPVLTDILTIGQPVAVTYLTTSGTTPHASMVRAVPGVGTSGSVTASEMRSSGTVKSFGANSITIIGGSGGGASFEQTFQISEDTKVVGKGLGTAAAPTGGKAPFKELISAGDKVSVSYHKAGDLLQASDVRVTAKGTH
jgi:hypothetical protein